MWQFAVWLAGVGSPAPIVRPQFEVMKKERVTQPVPPEVFLEQLNLKGYDDESYLKAFEDDSLEVFYESNFLQVYRLVDSEGNVSTLTIGYAPNRRWQYVYGCITVNRWSKVQNQIESSVFLVPPKELKRHTISVLDRLQANGYEIKSIPFFLFYEKSTYQQLPSL